MEEGALRCFEEGFDDGVATSIEFQGGRGQMAGITMPARYSSTRRSGEVIGDFRPFGAWVLTSATEEMTKC